MNNSTKTALISPLDWGLGHASRIIPLVHCFKSTHHKVILAGSGKSAELLKSTFKEDTFIHLPSFKARYPFSGIWFPLNILLQMPLMLYSIIRENYLLKQLVKELGIDVIVSDNRYGLYSRKTYNIIVTHQLSPVLPRFLKVAEHPLSLFIRSLLKKFDECWIPDYPGENNLSGALSHKHSLLPNSHFIGPLSRFINITPSKKTVKYDLAIVLSGPQPELGRITKHMISQVLRSELKSIMICGLQDIKEYFPQPTSSGLKLVSHLQPDIFRHTIENASVIICSAGYSGIMDLVELGRTAILVPTPGQTEQEYLSEYLHLKNIFYRISYREFDIVNIGKYCNELRSRRHFQAPPRIDLMNLPYFRRNTTTITDNPRRNPE